MFNSRSNEVMLKALARMAHQQLGSAFQRWMEYVEELHYQRQMVGQALKRMSHRHAVAWAFEVWAKVLLEPKLKADDGSKQLMDHSSQVRARTRARTHVCTHARTHACTCTCTKHAHAYTQNTHTHKHA